MPEEKLNDGWCDRIKGMTCSTCMWHVEKTKTDTNAPRSKTLGRCRRRAPTMNGYPVVFQTDWCGDHKLDENKT